MRVVTIPNSYGTELREYNKCHTPAGSSEGGEFCSKPGGAKRQTIGQRMKARAAGMRRQRLAGGGEAARKQRERDFRMARGRQTQALIRAIRKREEGEIEPPGAGRARDPERNLGSRATALLQRVRKNDHGYHDIQFGATGSGRYGYGDQKAAEKLRDRGLIDIESGGISRDTNPYSRRQETHVIWRLRLKKPEGS